MFVEPQHQPITTKPADPFSLPALIAWLETMPGDETYNYFCMGECLLGRWVKSIDNHARHITPNDVDKPFSYYIDGQQVDLSAFEDVANGPNDYRASSVRWTFGAALTRARKALSDQQSGALADREASL